MAWWNRNFGGTRITRRLYICLLASGGITLFLAIFFVPISILFGMPMAYLDYIFLTPLIVFGAMVLELILFDR